MVADTTGPASEPVETDSRAEPTVSAEESAEVFADADAYDMPEYAGAVLAGNVVGSAVSSLDADYADVSFSAIASANTGAIDASGSALGLTRVDGDAEVTFSAVVLATAQGDATISQSYVSAFVAGEHMNVTQAATAAALSKTITFEQAGAGVAVSGETTVCRGFIGLLVSGKTDIAEDSRVLISGWGLAVLALALLGGFGLIAVAMGHGAHRLAAMGQEMHLPKMLGRCMKKR